MQKSLSGKLFSASDLVNFSACSHLTHLDLVNMETPLPKAADSEEMVLIQDKGFEHEGRYLEHLRKLHGDVVDLKSDGTDAQAFESTCVALQSGTSVLFQPTFLSAPWVGHADFLIRVETPSKLGAFSYEVVDTKLSRTSRESCLGTCTLSLAMAAKRPSSLRTIFATTVSSNNGFCLGLLRPSVKVTRKNVTAAGCAAGETSVPTSGSGMTI